MGVRHDCQYFQKETWHLSPGDKVCNILGVIDAPRKHLSQVCHEGAKLVREGAPEVVVEEHKVDQPVVQHHRLSGGHQDGEELAHPLVVGLLLLLPIVASQVGSSPAVLGLEVKAVLHQESGKC